LIPISLTLNDRNASLYPT